MLLNIALSALNKTMTILVIVLFSAEKAIYKIQKNEQVSS